MGIGIGVLILASLVGSGVLFRHQRVLTFLGVAGALFEAQWLLLTLLARTFLLSVEPRWVFVGGAVILLALWSVGYRKWQFPYRASIGSGWRDIIVGIILLLVVTAAWSVARVNGFQGFNWVSHSFYNGDVATFGSLVQRSLITDGLVQENPFAGSGSLEYPTLLHAGVASFFQSVGVGANWLHFLPVLTYLQILLTIPLFFLLFDMLGEKLKEGWGVRVAQGGLVFYVLALAWDNYIYPQSHFFLTGLFLLLVVLLVKAYGQRGLVSYVTAGIAVVLAVLLLLANAVTGTAAVALLGVLALARMSDKKRELGERGAYLVLLAGLAALFILATPGNGAFGMPGFSYTAALDMARLAPIIMVLLITFFLTATLMSFLHIASAVLVLLGFVTFFFSTRDIVIENASRFFYHAILVGFPVLLAPLIQLFYWLRRQLLYVSRGIMEQAVAWVALGAIVLFFLLPAGASVASAHDNLWRKDEQTVKATERLALWWIEENAPPQAIFVASPEAPFAIPFFTGRSLLRTNYWLSPDDIVLNDVMAAFAGDKAAQEKVLGEADYLFLSADERKQWEPLPLKKVFDNTAYVIYQIKQEKTPRLPVGGVRGGG